MGKETKPLTSFMFSTGGSMKREPRLETMKEVTQNATRSWRRERTISIRCISLQAFSHSPGEEGVVAGSVWKGKDLNKEAPAGSALPGGSWLRGTQEKREGIENKGKGTHMG